MQKIFNENIPFGETNNIFWKLSSKELNLNISELKNIDGISFNTNLISG